MKQIRISIISMILLAPSCYCIRFPLHTLHGMKDWPLVLEICSICTIFADTFFSHGTVLSLSAAFGYPAGFLAGLLLGCDYGRGSSMWIIWTAIYLAVIIIDAVCRKKKRS